MMMQSPKTTARSEKRYIIKIAYDDAFTKNNNC